MKTVPRVHFAHLPTQIEALPKLSAHVGNVNIYIKRDDQTGLALGGNKTRKLEFLVAEAIEQGADTLVSAGALQSNHCRQTAAAAAKMGLRCILVLDGQPTQMSGGNYLLDKLFDAEIILIDNRTKRNAALKEAFDKAGAKGQKPYLVPYGGSSPTGALAYAFALEEFMQQGLHMDYMVFASSSGGTQAGFTLGQKIFGYDGKIIGVSIDETEADLKAHAAALASEASAKLGTKIDFTPADVNVTDKYCKAGYGVLTELESNAVKLFARLEGLVLDPVYTGRAAGGLIDMIKNHYFEAGKNILFWHTGGQAALFSDKYSNIL